VKRYWLLAAGMVALFLALFGLTEALGISFLHDPSAWMGRRGGLAAAAAGFGLLVADVFIPVPASIVMVAHGALFGTFAGAALSLAGSMGATWLGFAVGRRGGPLLARLVTPAEKARADALLRKYGALAVLVSRPIPLLAETVAILAGASPMGWGRMTVAALAGNLPACLLYALAGASSRSFENGLLMMVPVLILAGLFWWLGRNKGQAIHSPLPVDSKKARNTF
jgi:uncharacterized membrane protein YdjX (TVP38/TMEM64 family)